MAYVNKQIRDSLKLLLKDKIYHDATPLKIYFDDPYNIQTNQTPCITILTDGFDSEDKTIGQKMGFRTLNLQVSLIIKANTDVQDKLDNLSLQFEEELFKDKNSYTLNGLVKDIVLVNANYDREQQENNMAIIHYNLNVKYYVMQNNPSVFY